jgi:threonine/homoserine/homoserine lactone efflux protein
MLDIHDVAMFLGASPLLNLTPGPDTLYAVSHASARGWRAGAVAALGIGAGRLVHILAATLGLSALLLASARAFATLRCVGAACLVRVGVARLAARAAGRPGLAARAARTFSRVTGAVFVALGLRLAFAFAFARG